MLVQNHTEENSAIKQRLKQTMEKAKQLAHQMQILTGKIEEYKQVGRVEGKVTEQPDQVFGLNISFFPC